jgi:hypothetical protein
MFERFYQCETFGNLRSYGSVSSTGIFSFVSTAKSRLDSLRYKWYLLAQTKTEIWYIQ